MFSFAHTWMLCFWPSRRDLCVLMAQSTLKHTGCSLTTLVARHCVWRTARHSGKISQRKLAVRNYNVLHTPTFTNVIYSLRCLGLPWPLSPRCRSSVLGSQWEIFQFSRHFMPHTHIHLYTHVSHFCHSGETSTYNIQCDKRIWDKFRNHMTEMLAIARIRTLNLKW